MSDNILAHNVTHTINREKFDEYNLFYWNINSLRNKLYQIENEINTFKGKPIQFITLTETRIFEHDIPFYNIPKYNAYFSCREDGHGGAALYVHESIDSNLIESGCKFKVNYVIVNVPSLRSSIAVIYKKPTVSHDKFSMVLTEILTKTNRIILIGDTNIDILKNNTITNQYLTLIRSLGSDILNSTEKKFATRINNHINAMHTISSTIDHVISNNFNFKFGLSIMDSHLSDHRKMTLAFKDPSNAIKNFITLEQNFSVKKLDLKIFRPMLSRELSIYTPDNMSELINIINSVKERCISTKTLSIKNNPHKPWVNNELRQLIAERNRYFKLKKKISK